jgi:hypothetical protein
VYGLVKTSVRAVTAGRWRRGPPFMMAVHRAERLAASPGFAVVYGQQCPVDATGKRAG